MAYIDFQRLQIRLTQKLYMFLCICTILLISTQQNTLIIWFLYKQKQNGTQGRWLNQIDESFQSTYEHTRILHTTYPSVHLYRKKKTTSTEWTFEIYNETVSIICIHTLICI